MTGKLIKYEARCVGRQIGIIWAALPIIALAASFAGWLCSRSQAAQIVENSGFLRIVFHNLPMLVYIVMFAALIVMTLFIAVMRFYKGLLKEEGYLMHTLPVKPWQLILSKGTVTGVMVLISIIVGAASIVLLNLVGNLSYVADIFKAFGDGLQRYPIGWLYGFECLVLVVFGILSEVFKIYAALSIGQLSGRHKLLLSAAAYVGIGIVFMMLATKTIDLLVSPILVVSDQALDLLAENGSSLIQLGFIGALVYFAVQIIIYYIVGERLLAKHLNLE